MKKKDKKIDIAFYSKMYQLMYRSRKFEEIVMQLWHEGTIFGEMHMSVGEEAIHASIIKNLEDGDAIAVDHRGTAPFFMRGIDPISLLLEFIGHKDGLCSGQGGHMHLFSREHNMTSSGIVGASGSTAMGFALSHKYKNNKNIAVALFGEGAINQGMLLESFNMTSALELPVLFVCKDNNWAITTQSDSVTGGVLLDRAQGFGIAGEKINGLDFQESFSRIGYAIKTIRKTGKPYFIHATCVHREGHFLGDQLIALHRTTGKILGDLVGSLTKSLFKLKGGLVGERGESLGHILKIMTSSKHQLKSSVDPLVIAKKMLKNQGADVLSVEKKADQEIDQILKQTLQIIQGGNQL